MRDKLIDIPLEDLPTLRDLFRKDWPRYNVGYSIVDNYRRWFQQDPDLNSVKVCSLNGDWSDGTFVIIDHTFAMASTMNPDHSRLKTALSLVDYTVVTMIASIDNRLIETVQKFIADAGLELITVSMTKWNHMPQAEAAKLTVEPPEGITLKRLTEDQADTANEIWPFKHPGSDAFLRRLAKYNISVGAFTQDEELVAWSFRLPVGGLGALQVVDSYKRKGLGSLIVRAMAKAISETGDDVFAPVVVDNYPSQNMFEKVGFKPIDNMHWLPIRSTIPEN